MNSIMTPSAIEYFADNGKLYFIKDRYVSPFSELELNDIRALRQDMQSNPEAAKAIERVISDPMDQLQQFAICRYGRLNEVPDFVNGKSTDFETPHTGCQATCRFGCKICKRHPAAQYGQPTAREIEIACLIPGRTDIEIADHLNISDNTVKMHVARLRSKTGEHSRTGIVRWAMNNHLV